jgi:RimJ/RimL family protein N-acetyltransferase
MEKVYLPEEIKGERITLKRHSIDLAERMFQYVDQDRERLRKFLPWVDGIKEVQDEINYINFANAQWDLLLMFDYGIYRSTDDKYMGNCGIHTISWAHNRCEIGYWILGEYEGKGYVSEAVLLLEKTLMKVGFNRIEIRCESANARSASVPKNNGYQLDGVLRENMCYSGRYVDSLVFSKLRSEIEK